MSWNESLEKEVSKMKQEQIRGLKTLFQRVETIPKAVKMDFCLSFIEIYYHGF